MIPNTHKKDLTIAYLPESMMIAIKAFLLVCAVRRIRKEGIPHNSLLIHVTRFTNVQGQIKDLVEKVLRTMVARILSGSDPLSDFQSIWEDDFVLTSKAMAAKGFSEAIYVSWTRSKKNYSTLPR